MPFFFCSFFFFLNTKKNETRKKKRGKKIEGKKRKEEKTRKGEKEKEAGSNVPQDKNVTNPEMTKDDEVKRLTQRLEKERAAHELTRRQLEDHWRAEELGNPSKYPFFFSFSSLFLPPSPFSPSLYLPQYN